MPINNKNQKEESRSSLLRHLGLPKGIRAVVLSYIKDPQILWFFQNACEAMGVVLITEIDDMAISGSDIWITDILDETLPIQELSQKRVVPVIPIISPYSKVFSEFDPMKFEGNAFLFESVNQFQMLEKLIRALENLRYAWDKRMLLQNIENTF